MKKEELLTELEKLSNDELKKLKLQLDNLLKEFNDKKESGK